MATIVTKSIGTTGRDYATIAEFFAAIPSNLITADQAWVGELYNDSEFTITSKVSLGTKTTDDTHYIKLTAAAGHSFRDHANKLTNALRYNQANGVGISCSVDSDFQIDTSATDAFIIDGLQFKITSTYGKLANMPVWWGRFSNNIVQANSGNPVVELFGIAQCYNNLIYLTGSVESYGFSLGAHSAAASFNTLHTASSGSGKPFNGFGSTTVADSIYYGFTDDPVASSFSYMATDDATVVGSNGVVSLAASATWESVTPGSWDFRVKAGAAVINAGTPISGITTDILGQTRSATTPTIGAMEYIAGSNNPPTFSGPNIGNLVGTEGVALSSNTVSDSFADADALTFSAIGTWPAGVTVSSGGVISGTPTTAGTYATLKVRATDTAAQTVDSDTFTFTIAAAGSGTITTPALKNDSGTVLASLSGWTVNVYHATTGERIVQKTGLTTSAGGVLTITDALIVAGTTYAYEPVHATYGRRSPTGVAA